MSGPLPRCFDAVVTGGARTGDAGVVVFRGTPGGIAVATRALLAGRDVARRLALRLQPVMAGCAITARFQVIESSCRYPARGGVARAAVVRGRYVSRRLRRRADARPLRMARGAHSWGAGEYCVHVTALAGLQAVRASEFESRRQVVKVAPGHLG